MNVEYMGLKEITGPLVVIDGVKDATFEEMVEITVGKQKRLGRIIEINGETCVVQIFEGTRGVSLQNTRTKLLGKPLKMSLSKELLGRVLDGMGRPVDGLGEIYPEKSWDINGEPINPVMREYPRNFIQTGISSIDGLTTLIRGQKLPVFSGSGLPHNQLAVQIVRQAKIADTDDQNFAVVLDRVVMFLNLANDPVVERIVTPRCALTAAEYLAYERGMHVLVILTDMTSYAEALREISSSKGEIPSRKGYPGYLYSDLASIYERAGMIRGRKGSITQIPILTMPNDDITHPIPDLTGYITEGQIVLDKGLSQKGVYPPVIVLPSLSRLMKDGIGKGYTREDHPQLANQLFASYAKVIEIRALASVIGEDELSDIDKKYMRFGRVFEAQFISQDFQEERSINDTLDLGWLLLGLLPKEELDRLSPEILDKYYVETDESKGRIK
jgi:V/A-type H+-transporting ATPase subunit B